MGPFMEVMMTSSTTKMVIGGVCVTHAANTSETKIHMDVASRAMHVSDASIYIEGGFGVVPQHRRLRRFRIRYR